MPNIVEVAVQAGSFNTLVTAVKAAGLVETLSSPGPFTVFAPTDEAFAKVDPNTLQALLQPAGREQLVKILTYHVIPGKHLAAEILGLTSVKTVEGGDLKIDASDGVHVGNAAVVQADIETDNGVIHVIDAVLIPN